MRKAILLALAAVSAMLFALPATASAESWTLDNTPAAFTSTAGVTKLTTTTNETVECGSSTGSGEYTNGTTATATLFFHSCKGPSSTTCTTAGQPSGTIKTNVLTVHNVWANKHGVKTLAALFTPPATGESAGKFATFKCTLFGLGPEITVTGTLIGEVELTSACNTETTVSHLNFQSTSAGHQTITTLWNTAGTYDLTADVSGSPTTASQDGTGTITFAKKVKPTC